MLSIAPAMLAMPTGTQQQTGLIAESKAAPCAASIESQYLGLFRDVILNKAYNPSAQWMIDGSSWPPEANALSMAGQRRIDSFSSLVATAVEDGVPGHVIETGVWRGGGSFVAAKTLELLGSAGAGRLAYLADSFHGIPKQDDSADFLDKWSSSVSIMNDNSVERVQVDQATIGLDDLRTKYVVGYFNESLPKLVRDEPDVQFAVVRLDGDTYSSTWDAIEALYPRLSPGGFLIVDDYSDWASCRQAITDYRAAHGIAEPLIMTPHGPDEEQRGIYWRKQPSADHELCARCASSSHLRPAGALLHQKPQLVAHPEGLLWKKGQERLTDLSTCEAA